MSTITQYSEFELKEQAMKVAGANAYSPMNCVGKSEEELDAKIITKNCRGVKAKERVRGTGTGKLTQSLHVPVAVYNAIYDLEQSGLETGVRAYGKPNRHPEVTLVQKVEDEDGVVKYKAYPRAILESGPKRPIENGSEEVAELSLEWALLPDESGYCMYELFEGDNQTLETTWMTAWDPADMIASA